MYKICTLILYSIKTLHNKSRKNEDEIAPGIYATDCEALGALHLSNRLIKENYTRPGSGRKNLKSDFNPKSIVLLENPSLSFVGFKNII